jgi:hypothetical protein
MLMLRSSIAAIMGARSLFFHPAGHSRIFCRPLAVLLVITSSGLPSCTTIRPVPSRSDTIGYCHQVQAKHKPTLYPEPLHTLPPDSALTQHFSYKSLNIANAFHLIPLLSELLKAEQRHAVENSDRTEIDLLKLNQRLTNKILQAHLEIAAISSAMDCEEERADQLAFYLNRKQQRTERMLTVAAIVVGAVTGIVSGFFLGAGRDKSADAVGVVGGFTEVGLASGILFSEKKLAFSHPYNPLREVWYEQDSLGIFPASVWYYLNYHHPLQPETTSLRTQLIERWLSFGQLSAAKTKQREEDIQLFFGEGGKYTSDQLTNRANMFDQLKSFINLMKQDLDLLMYELIREEEALLTSPRRDG